MSIIRYHKPALSTRTSFDGLSSLREDLNRLFDFSFPSFAPDAGLFSGWTPALDIHQDKENVYVKVELPGLKKEEIDISLQDGVLTIAGERKHEVESKEGESFRSERYFGRFHRSVSLPTTVDSEKVKAAYTDGILSVTLPKAEEAKPKQIEVSVS